MWGVKHIIAVTVLFVIGLPVGASATVWYVDQRNASGVEDGTSWGTAYKSLQVAIDASASAGGGSVWVVEGTYGEAITVKDRVEIYGGFQGTETEVSDRDWVAHVTTIDASAVDFGTNVPRVVTWLSTKNSRLDGFTVTGGGYKERQYPQTDAFYDGFGIYCREVNESNVLANCRVSGNTGYVNDPCATGIYCYDSSLTITHCEVSDNVGGGIGIHDGAPTIDSCIVRRNTTNTPTFEWGEAFGIACYLGSPAIVDCVILDNERGVLISDVTAARIKGCIIADHRKGPNPAYVWPAPGTGLFVHDSDIAIRNCRILRNGLDGVFAHFIWGMQFTNCVIGGNGDDGVYFYNAHNVKFLNCTVDGNARNGIGGNVENLVLTNSIVTNNGDFAVSAAAGLKITNCLFSHNARGVYMVDAELIFRSAFEMDLYSGFSTRDLDGAPSFVNAPGGDYHLSNGSPALDRGALQGAPTSDIEGNTRPGDDNQVDIGAYEAESAFAPAPDVTPPVTRVTAAAAVTSSFVDISWVAGDAESGIQSLALWYRRNGGAWTEYPVSITDSPIHFDTSLSGGEGGYEFRLSARDNAGNQDDVAGDILAHTIVLTHFDGARVYVDGAATGTESGLDWAGAFHTIQSGASIAAAFGVNEVWVAEGTYPEIVTAPSGVSIFGGFDRSKTDVDGRDLADHTTLLDGAHALHGSAAQNVVILDGVKNARLDGFTIAGCAKGVLSSKRSGTDKNTASNNLGGAVYCRNLDSSNVISHCTIRDNESYYGGGIHCVNASPRIDECAIRGNSANLGGGIYCESGAEPEITRCTISGNSAIGADGNGGGAFGGILTDCEISGNLAFHGGGVYRGSLYRCTVSDNYAQDGGGVCGSSVYHCTIRNNAAIGEGGGCDGCGPVVDSIIDGNTAETGGGIYGASAERCFLTNNTAKYGGAMFIQLYVRYIASYWPCPYNYPNPYPDWVTCSAPRNCVIAGNYAEIGAVVDMSVYFQPDYTLYCDFKDEKAKNEMSQPAHTGETKVSDDGGKSLPTITWYVSMNTIWGNTAASGKLFGVDTSSAHLAVTSSIIRNNPPIGSPATVTYSNIEGGYAGVGNIDAPAGFADEAQGDFYLQSNSPCIDTGASDGFSTDILGTLRPLGSRTDMGAYEYAGPRPIGITSRPLSLPSILTEGTLAVPWASWGGDGAVQYVELYYRLNAGNWIKYPGAYTSSLIVFDPSSAGGDGLYEFCTVATDSHGNRESLGEAQAQIVVMTSFPGPRLYVSKKGDNQTGQDWRHALTDLSGALTAAEKFKIPETWIGEGAYTGNVVLTGSMSLCGGFAGVEQYLFERDIAAHPTVIHPVSEVSNYYPVAVIQLDHVSGSRVDGIVIDGGNKQSLGLYGTCTDTLTVLNCTIRNFNAYVDSSIAGGRVTFTDCVITNNGSRGVRFDGCNAIVRRCTISGNANPGIEATGSELAVEACTITGNEIGIYAINASSFSVLRTRISENKNAGINLWNCACVASIRDCIIDKNGTPDSGTGLEFMNTESELTNCIVSRHASAVGLGIACLGNSAPVIVNCTIVGNRGGLKCDYGSSPVVINTAFAGNLDYGIYQIGSHPSSTLKSCLFHENPNAYVLRDYWYGGGTLFYPGVSEVNHNVPGDGRNIDGDPRFVNASDGDYRLRYGSAAVDSGTLRDAAQTDIDGTHRPMGAGFDIGAYEQRFPIAGDVSGDDVVGAVDVQMAINASLGIDTSLRCDFDHSGTVDAADLQLIINAALGIE